ncbi:cupin domain-containing protein [Phaeobacter sp.]|uniref:helix-turn-helix domain-containing protein n=1 Tax=Phaeobacter sp. TaxID=1902409 RepID=UPI0025F141F7|nr:cupin domain-containing protein [Phaeobacter sp.]
MPSIGDALCARRKELKLSMQTLAEQAGLSVGFISQVERGHSTPSLGSLNSIASVLGLPMSSLLDQPTGEGSQTKRQNRSTYSIGDNTLSYERLSTRFNHSQLHSLIVHEPPGHRYEPISHRGEELFYILAGSVTVEIDGEHHILNEGDSIHFDSYRTHSSWNHGTETASFLWCGTMDVFGADDRGANPLHKGPDGSDC